MPLELAIRNRFYVCCLMLMLAPYGISVPTFIEAAPAGRPETVVKLDDLYSTSYMPKVHTGGTIALPPVFTVVDPSHRIH